MPANPNLASAPSSTNSSSMILSSVAEPSVAEPSLGEFSPTRAGYLRVLVVDDEQPAIDELCWLLLQQSEVAMVQSATSASAALRLLDAHVVDVVFLDIEMPELNGLELARVLRRFASPPAVVFVTAFERHAVDAFAVKAVDYILKPIRTDRLDETMRRIVALIPEPTIALEAHAESVPKAGPRSRVAIESAGRTSFVDRIHVVAVEASRDYVRLHTATKSYLVRIPISELESEWSGVGFVRVHRSYLVAVQHVKELLSEGQGLSVLVGSLTIPVSRTYSRNLRERLVSDRGLPRGQDGVPL
jgi:two-component system, LytTR family, response regulator LytT